MMKYALALLAALSASGAYAQQGAAESRLCRSQLELLVSGDKFNAAERERFERQCACLAAREQGDAAGSRRSCAEE